MRTAKKAKFIIILVDVPKPLSIKLAGIVSSSSFGVAQDNIPLANPNSILPKHIELKSSTKVKHVAMAPRILNIMIVLRLPFLTKSPPNMLPRAIPTRALVDRIVTLKSNPSRSVPQYSWYLKAGTMGPVDARARPNCILLTPTTRVKPNKYEILACCLSKSFDFIDDLANLVDALSVIEDGPFCMKLVDSSSWMSS